MKLTPTLTKRLNKVGEALRNANAKGKDFKTAARLAKVSLPTAMKYAQLLNLSWTNYKPRGPYSKDLIKTK